MELDVKLKLEDIVKMPNIAEKLSDADLAKLGQDAYHAFENDLFLLLAFRQRVQEERSPTVAHGALPADQQRPEKM